MDKSQRIIELEKEVESKNYLLGSIHNYDGDAVALLERYQRDEKLLQSKLDLAMDYIKKIHAHIYLPAPYDYKKLFNSTMNVAEDAMNDQKLSNTPAKGEDDGRV